MCGCDALHGALRSSLRAAFEENRLHPRPAQPGSSTRSGGGLGGLVYTPGGWVRSPRYAIGGSSSPPQRSHFPGQRDWYLSEEASHHLLEGVLENLVHVYGDPHVVHPPSGSSPSSGHTPRPNGAFTFSPVFKLLKLYCTPPRQGYRSYPHPLSLTPYKAITGDAPDPSGWKECLRPRPLPGHACR